MPDLCVTVDVEGDWIEHPQEQSNFDAEKIVRGLENCQRCLTEISQRMETPVPVTWFVRCDDSVARGLGRPSGLLEALEIFIQSRLDAGDLFGLHPHFYRIDDADQWQVARQSHHQAEIFQRAAAAWKTYFGSSPHLTRMGEAMMSNDLAAAMETVGVKLDSTALPGRKRMEPPFCLDWEETQPRPYWPSVEDYRRSAEDGAPSRSFVEIPFSMLPLQAKEDNYDKKPISRYLNLGYKPEILQLGFKSLNPTQTLVSVVHLHEIFDSGRSHPLVSFSSQAFGKNLVLLKEYFERLGEKLEFTTLDHVKIR